MTKSQFATKSLVAIVFLASPIIANSCEIRDFSASSQADLDKQFLASNCTEINGNRIVIRTDYKGAFSLPGITRITGGIVSSSESGYNVSVPGLTEIHMDDLLTIDEFVLGPTSMKSLTLPKLSNATRISISAANTSLQINFPVLEFSGLHLSGNISEIQFPNLTSSERFDVDTSKLGFDISLPALKTVTEFSLYGNFTGLSLPVLENVTSYLLVEPNEKVDLDYDFPSLKRGSAGPIGGIYLYNAKGLKMPLLESINGLYISMSTKDQLVTIPALTNASDIDITGSVSDVQLPNLNHLIKSLKIHSTAKVNCTSANETYTRIQKNSVNAPLYTCEKMKGPRLTKGQKDGLGIGLGLGLGVLAIVGLAFGLRWLSERKKGKVMKDESGHEKVENSFEGEEAISKGPVSSHTSV